MLSPYPLIMIVLLQWVADGSPSHSTPIKIENSNQFVPVNTNPKEFKKVQKLVSPKHNILYQLQTTDD